MRLLLLNTLLGLAWVALTGVFNPSNFAIGFMVGFGLLWMTQRLMEPSTYFTKIPQVLGLVFFFFIEIIVANLRVAVVVLSPRLTVHPAVVAIPLDMQSDVEIALLANLITLTPGTLHLDVSSDRKIMYIHTMFVDDLGEFREHIKQGFERRIMEVFE